MPTQEELENMSPEEIAELQKQNCPFCKIIAGEIPSQKIYEDDYILAILDINPSRKGHVLILPKEHQPILPLIPPETFKQMFRMTKLISKGLKKATLTNSVSVFIANGAVAGQQSPHFLFHLIPRESGDGLDHLDLKGDESLFSKQQEIHTSLKHNMTRMMQSHLQREGESQGNAAGSGTQNPAQQLSQEQVEEKRQKIGKIIEDNPQVREMLTNDLQQFKELINKNDELKNLFDGVDLQALSNNLKQMVDQDSFDKNTDHTTQNTEHRPQNTENSTQNTEHRTQSTEPRTQYPEHRPPNTTSRHDTDNQPEVFLGSDPYAQRDGVMKYFEQKPKAKELLKNDPETFKELLSKRDDIKPIFENVDVDKLSQKLRHLEGGDS